MDPNQVNPRVVEMKQRFAQIVHELLGYASLSPVGRKLRNSLASSGMDSLGKIYFEG